MAAARASSRYGHRDSTMILIGYRHGLRANELVDLQWHQVELTNGRLHVRRAKGGSPSEIRALRRLQREQGASSHVFMTERGGPMTPKAFHALFARIGVWAKMPLPVHTHMLRHGCGYALANAGHDTRSLQAWLGHKNIQHGPLHRAGAGSVQGLLEGLKCPSARPRLHHLVRIEPPRKSSTGHGKSGHWPTWRTATTSRQVSFPSVYGGDTTFRGALRGKPRIMWP
jgi:hypothetical protein